MKFSPLLPDHFPGFEHPKPPNTSFAHRKENDDERHTLDRPLKKYKN